MLTRAKSYLSNPAPAASYCGQGGTKRPSSSARCLCPGWHRSVGLLVLTALALALAGCGGGDDASAEREQASSPSAPSPRVARLVELSSCPVKSLPHGGGSDVRALGLSCEEVGRLLPKFGLPIGRNDPKSGIFDRGNGWTCWAQFLGRTGPVQNVCWRGDSILVYKFE